MMDTICGGNRPYLNTNSLDEEHIKSKDLAMEQFIVKRKMGGDEFSESYKFKLETVRQYIHNYYFVLLN
jgi:atlastin